MVSPPDQGEYLSLAAAEQGDFPPVDYASKFDFQEGYLDGHKVCTSWNVFNKEGCQYEFMNPGKKCKFIHHCSICQANGLNYMPHKAWQCSEMDNLSLSYDNF